MHRIKYPFRCFVFGAILVWVGCTGTHHVGNAPFSEANEPPRAMNQGGHPGGPDYPRIPITDFTRVWSGKQDCNSTGTGNITLVVTVRDSFSVFMSGLRGTDRKIWGTVMGYTVNFARQALGDGVKGDSVEGKLVLANNRHVLSSYLRYYNQRRIDTCVSHLTPGGLNEK